MSYICLIANRNGAALSGDSRLTLEPRFLHIHTDRTQKVFSDPKTRMAWACCGLTLYLGVNYFKLTSRILRQSHRSLSSRLSQISAILSKATRLQHFVSRKDSVFVLLLAVMTDNGVQVQKLSVVNGKAKLTRHAAPVFLQAGWVPALHQKAPVLAEYENETLDQLIARARERCVWAMKRDRHLSEENRKHQQTIGGSIRVTGLSAESKQA